MKLKEMPEEARRKFEEAFTVVENEEFKQIARNALNNDDNKTVEDVQNEIWNGLQFIRDEAAKAQRIFAVWK